MPAPASSFGRSGPRERLTASVAVVFVQFGLALVLLSGFRVELVRQADVVERLIQVALPKAPRPARPPPVKPVHKPTQHASAAPKAAPKPLGGSPGPRPAHAPPSVTPVV